MTRGAMPPCSTVVGDERRSTAQREPSSGDRQSLPSAGYCAEGLREIGADKGHHGDGGDCDKGSDQPILDCRDTGLVPDQLGTKRAHEFLLAVQTRTRCSEKFEKTLKRKEAAHEFLKCERVTKIMRGKDNKI